MINPFKKLQQKRQQQSSSSTLASYGRKQGGITIAVGKPLAGNKQQQQQNGKQDLDHVLPPVSDYRQSLIMPHLTRRFTLLRAPDGSLVSPEAMRAHLRAQRARARATNLAAHNFLTEEEENEIIEQLRVQAKVEGRDFEAEKTQSEELWTDGFASGTDGFGSWGPSSNSGESNLQRLTETLSELSSSDSSKSHSQRGGLFSGRSSERDLNYLRTLIRPDKKDKLDAVNEVESVEEGGAKQADGRTTNGTGDARLNNQENDASSVEASMPGDFLAAERRASQQKLDGLETPKSPSADTPTKNSFLEVPTPDRESANASPTGHDSRLLTTLSPEAFKRVSTALEEVYGLMAKEGSVSSTSLTPDKAEFGPNSIQPANRSLYDSMVTSDEPLEQIGSDDDRISGRRSADSDQRSFTSAVSQVPESLTGLSSHSLRTRDPSLAESEDDTKDIAHLTKLSNVHIEDGGLNIGLSPVQRDTLPLWDSSRTIMQGGGDFATNGNSLATQSKTLSVAIAEEPTPIISPALTPQPGNGSRTPSLVLPDETSASIAADGDETIQSSAGVARKVNFGPPPARGALAADSVYASHTSPDISSPGLPYDSASPSIPQSTRAADDAISMPPPAPPSRDQPSASAAIGSTMTTLGEAWSPQSDGAHQRGSSITSMNSVDHTMSTMRGAHRLAPTTHSRNGSADRMAYGVASDSNLKEQPSLSSIRRHYRQHSRTASRSSEGGQFSPASPRSSRAMSPVPVLNRSARSANYFPPPSSGSSMQSYAAGFKPPSAVSPAAIAAVASTASSPRPTIYAANGTSSYGTYDATGLNRAFNRARDSGSTHNSHASPHFSSGGTGFSPGLGITGASSTETGATSYAVHSIGSVSTYTNDAGHSRSGSSGAMQPFSFHTLARARSNSSSQAGSQRLASPSSAPMAFPAPPAHTQQQLSGGLMPHPPSDPEQAEKWRSTYGAKAADASSIRTSSEGGMGDELRDVEGADEDDLWAQMANAAYNGKARESRPVSAFPPDAAEDHLAGAGITFAQLATYQEQLVRSASKRVPEPPLPTTPANQIISSFPSNRDFATPLSEASSIDSPAGQTRLEKARERARMIAEKQSRGEPISPSMSGTEAFGRPSADADSASRSTRHPSELSPFGKPRGTSTVVSPDSSISHDHSRTGKSEVMYDVTTSHRPTSPPPRTRAMSSTGLPSLMDLNVGQSDRQSISLAQAVEQAASGPSNMYSSPGSWQQQHASSARANADPVDLHNIASGSSAFAHGDIFNTIDGSAAAEAPLDLPYAINYAGGASPSVDINNHPYGQFSSDNLAGPEQNEISGMLRSTSHNVLADRYTLQSPATAQSVWSDPGERQGPSPPSSNDVTAARSQLHDDIAAQARAATRALKEVDNGTVPTPPARSRTLSRRKSFKKIGKQISSPHLISTTQKMDHAVQLVRPDGSLVSLDKGKGPKKGRLPAFNAVTPPAVQEDGGSPGVPPMPYCGQRPFGEAHRRRSSSFGHEAESVGQQWASPQGFGTINSIPTISNSGTLPPASPGGQAFTQQQHQSTGNLSGSGGSGLSRFMSKIRARKPSDLNYGASTIDPFPTSPMGNSAYKSSSPAATIPASANYARSPGSMRSPANLLQQQQRHGPRDDSLSHTSSPHYRLDSTSIRRPGEKIRTPIVLKRESEVIMPGDMAPMLRSSPLPPSGESYEGVMEQSVAPKSSTPNSDDQILQIPASAFASAVPIHDQWEADAAAAAAIADGQVVELPEELAEAAMSPTIPASTTRGSLAPAPAIDLGDATPRLDSQVQATTSSDAASPTSHTSFASDSKTKADQRKLLRDTIVRRTIIIPADINFDDRRKSVMSTASRRKSRKPAAAQAEELPWDATLTSMSLSNSFMGAAPGDDSMVSNASTVRRSVQERTPTPPGIMGVGGAHRRKPSADIPSDAPLPKLPASTSGMTTLSLQQSLKPSAASSPGRSSERYSRIQSSYAGSLYDMYIGEHDSALSDDERARASDRNSKMLETRRHIEVTERADGSVVWQVIAGLADRGSIYSDYESRHSRASTSSFPTQDCDSLLPPAISRDSMASDQISLPTKSPAGLSNEDSRSFFAKPRGHRKSFSFDGVPPPLPTAEQEHVDVFEMASPDAISPTRIVYHSDAQLAAMLDALARGKDSAKFEFQAARPREKEVESHRSRVEAEIYTLLNQQSAYEQRRF